ncbi:MAG: gluconokinase [Clostridiaceae bacterium]
MSYIAIDIGTTSTKGILFGEGFKELKKVVSENNTLKNSDSRISEMDPMEVYQGVKEILHQLLQSREADEKISFISFSAYMHSVILVDGDGNPLTHAMLWSDGRAESYATSYKLSGKGLEYYKRTGTPIHPMSPLYKIMWLKNEEPSIFGKSTKIVSIKEFVLEKMVGEYFVDESMASATGLFNFVQRDWDEEILSDLKIKRDMLSTPVATTTVLPQMTIKFKSEMGISEDIPIVIGATDGCLANLGSVGYEKDLVITIGTSGAARIISDQPFLDEKGSSFCYILDAEHYIIGGAINNGGNAYEWFRKNVSTQKSIPSKNENDGDFESFNDNLKDTLPGSQGLLFLPFLTGERAPYYDSKLRGSYIGLTMNHGLDDMQRAVLEGICFSIKEVVEILKPLMTEEGTIHVNGGFTRSKEWVKILAEILGEELILSKNYESACIGAIILGLKGIHENLELSSMINEVEMKISPNPTAVATYQKHFEIYKNAIEVLIPIFHQMGIDRD